jgi:hypothetical protein
MSEFKIYRIIYNFNHSKMGFQNSITVEARNQKEATEIAIKEVEDCYGSKMIKRFSFKAPEAIKSL